MKLSSDEVYPALTGYTDRFSARPGESLALKASASEAGVVDVDVVRIWFADANPSGPGIQLDPVDSFPSMSFEGRYQRTYLGSYGVVPVGDFPAQPVLTFEFTIQPRLLRERYAALLSCGDSGGWTLAANRNGVELKMAKGATTLVLPCEFKSRAWYGLKLTIDQLSNKVVLAISSTDEGERVVTCDLSLIPESDWHVLYIAAEQTPLGMRAHFNGRIDDIIVRDRAQNVLAFWDFSLAISTQSIVDTGPQGLHGRLINLPQRAVRGSRWNGTEQRFSHAPSQYSAIHFHEDDIYDCGWETDLEVVLPERLHSGVYGIRMRQAESEDVVPFFVLPPRSGPTARICYIANTFTYQAYGNHARDNLDTLMEERIQDWETPRGPDTYPQFGFSTYNFHPDGSGIAFASRLRPLLTMRPGFLTFVTHDGAGLRHFPADSHLVEWFRRKGFDFDVVTDEDLHNEGVNLIADYSVVVTGSHPEYQTTQTLNALKSYRDCGGNLVYLGGNGFYWRIAKSERLPGAIEVRRNEGGIRAWATEPGEGYQMLDGEYGGLWRRNDRPPQQLVGVGFSAQGLFEGTYYRRTDRSYGSDVNWIFDGVEEERIGDYGFSGGGAAGFELDRADSVLGTPDCAVIIARSYEHPASFMAAPEETLSHIRTVTGESPNELIRSELLYMKLDNGAQVFATGSITFCGSLPHNNFSNGISQLLENVIDRFVCGS